MNASFEEILYASPDYDACLNLRYNILRAPLGLVYTVDQIQQEYDQKHFVLRNIHGDLVACLVFQILNNEILKMRQVAVSVDLQSQGYGKLLVENSELWARQHHFKRIVLHARDKAIPFYIKLGYAIIGEEFTEVGIPHREMFKSLEC